MHDHEAVKSVRGLKKGILLRMLSIGLAAAPAVAGAEPMPAAPRVRPRSLAALREERARLAHRPRRVVFNNDGDDHMQTPEATVEGFLAVRTTPLATSQVDTITYSTDRGSFGLYSHRTAIGQTLVPSEAQWERYRSRGHVSVLPSFYEADTDPLQEMIRWCRENGRELFWSMRMNDTHDSGWSEEQFPDFKKQRPNLLISRRDWRPPYSAWSAMDYSLPEVRELAYRFIEEVCRNYDIDGVELDFFRMLQYFPAVAWGGEAENDERAMMTDLVRRVRRMTEREGLRRGRPILLAARTPDSIAYSRAIGLDVGEWLEEGLLDILVAGGDFRLNEWTASVELARRHGVAVWADLDPAIRHAVVGGLNRNAITTLRGRALEAWAAGVDAIYLFNHFNPRHPLWYELGDPEALALMERTHFPDVKGFSGYFIPQQRLVHGARFHARPRLHPDDPLTLPGGRRAIELEWSLPQGVFPEGGEEGDEPPVRLTARLNAFGLDRPDQLDVRLNGQPLGPWRGGTAGRLEADLPPGLLGAGLNRWVFSLERVGRASPFTPTGRWDFHYEGRTLPADPWSYQPKERTRVELRSEALLLADDGTEPGDYQYVGTPWPLPDGGRAVIEARVRVVSGMNAILFGSGDVQQQLDLYPDRVGWGHPPRESRPLDTTRQFRHLRIEIDGPDLRLYLDGRLELETPGGFTHVPGWHRRQLSFGAGTSPQTGEALWSFVRARVDAVALTDLAVTVAPATLGQ